MAQLKGRGTISLMNYDASNVYTQHIPPILDIADALIRGRLSSTAYPFVRNDTNQTSRSQEVIIFIVGGSTYKEAQVLRQYNDQVPGVSIVLGGTTVHNSKSIMEDLQTIREQLGLP